VIVVVAFVVETIRCFMAELCVGSLRKQVHLLVFFSEWVISVGK
jgi:hypothetical protein